MATARTADSNSGRKGGLSRATDTEAFQEGYAMGDMMIDRLESRAAQTDSTLSKMAVMSAIRVIGGALIMLGIILVVLNEVYTLDTIANSTGPFADQIDSAQNTGGSALGLLIIGLLAAAGSRIMGMFGGGGGGF